MSTAVSGISSKPPIVYAPSEPPTSGNSPINTSASGNTPSDFTVTGNGNNSFQVNLSASGIAGQAQVNIQSDETATYQRRFEEHLIGSINHLCNNLLMGVNLLTISTNSLVLENRKKSVHRNISDTIKHLEIASGKTNKDIYFTPTTSTAHMVVFNGLPGYDKPLGDPIDKNPVLDKGDRLTAEIIKLLKELQYAVNSLQRIKDLEAIEPKVDIIIGKIKDLKPSKNPEERFFDTALARTIQEIAGDVPITLYAHSFDTVTRKERSTGGEGVVENTTVTITAENINDLLNAKITNLMTLLNADLYPGTANGLDYVTFNDFVVNPTAGRKSFNPTLINRHKETILTLVGHLTTVKARVAENKGKETVSTQLFHNEVTRTADHLRSEN